MSLSVRSKYLIILIFAVLVGLDLFARSKMPPYGMPLNELSDNYWGVMTDIAHRWRTLDFSFWSRGIGGGFDLFSSCEYPLLNPTNVMAWFLSDELRN